MQTKHNNDVFGGHPPAAAPNVRMCKRRFSFLIFLVCNAFGFVALVGPALASGHIRLAGLSISQAIAGSIKHLTLFQILCLLLGGAIISFVSRTQPALIAMSFIAYLPVIMAYDLCISPTSHNLLPFELLMYGFFALVVLVGAVLGMVLRLLFSE